MVESNLATQNLVDEQEDHGTIHAAVAAPVPREDWERRIEDPENVAMLNGSCVSDQSGLRATQRSINRDMEIKIPLQWPQVDDDGSGESLPSPIIAGPAPPDGGLWAWLVMLASFLCNGIIFGTINSGGVIFVALVEALEKTGTKNPASLASITLSLAIGTTFFLSMVSGVLTDKLGIRVTTIAGGAIATLGMFLSSIYYSQANILIVTMGLIFGIGASLAYTPSLVILGHYFSKRLGIVNGIVTAGSSIFTIIITQLLRGVIETHGLKVAFQLLSGLMSVLMICGLIFKPLLHDVQSPNNLNEERKKNLGQKCHKFFGQFINFEIWKNKRFVIWTLAIPSALFGYFVPYIHLVAYVKDVLGDDVKSQILVQCIGGTSGVGRIFFGLIADKPWVNRIVLQQMSFFCIGTLTMLLTSANTFWVFVLISLGMGLFDGCFISLLGPIAFDIVGPAGAPQAIGCLLAFCSIPLTLGPYIAGVMYDHLGSYVIPFLCAGIPPILGGFALFLIRCVKEPPQGTLGSPVKESTEKKNNVAVPNAVNPSQPEQQAFLNPDTENDQRMTETTNKDLLQVDN